MALQTKKGSIDLTSLAHTQYWRAHCKMFEDKDKKCVDYPEHGKELRGYPRWQFATGMLETPATTNQDCFVSHKDYIRKQNSSKGELKEIEEGLKKGFEEVVEWKKKQARKMLLQERADKANAEKYLYTKMNQLSRNFRNDGQRVMKGTGCNRVVTPFTQSLQKKFGEEIDNLKAQLPDMQTHPAIRGDGFMTYYPAPSDLYRPHSNAPSILSKSNSNSKSSNNSKKMQKLTEIVEEKVKFEVKSNLEGDNFDTGSKVSTAPSKSNSNMFGSQTSSKRSSLSKNSNWQARLAKKWENGARKIHKLNPVSLILKDEEKMKMIVDKAVARIRNNSCLSDTSSNVAEVIEQVLVNPEVKKALVDSSAGMGY